MSRPLRRSHARLAITPPASDNRDHAGRSRARAAVPAPSGRFLVPPPGGGGRGSTRKTPVCMGMPFIRKDRPEPGPDPPEGPQGPSFVSHKPRRTLSLFPESAPALLETNGTSPHGSMSAPLLTPLI